MPLLEELLIDPRAPVKAFRKACRYKPVKVSKTHIILSQKDQVVIVFVFPAGHYRLIKSGTRCNVDLTSYYRMDPVSLHLTVERDGAVHYAVIGYGA